VEIEADNINDPENVEKSTYLDKDVTNNFQKFK